MKLLVVVGHQPATYEEMLEKFRLVLQSDGAFPSQRHLLLAAALSFWMAAAHVKVTLLVWIVAYLHV